MHAQYILDVQACQLAAILQRRPLLSVTCLVGYPYPMPPSINALADAVRNTSCCLHICLGDFFWDDDFTAMFDAVGRLAAALRANRERFCKRYGVPAETAAIVCDIKAQQAQQGHGVILEDPSWSRFGPIHWNGMREQLKAWSANHPFIRAQRALTTLKLARRRSALNTASRSALDWIHVWLQQWMSEEGVDRTRPMLGALPLHLLIEIVEYAGPIAWSTRQGQWERLDMSPRPWQHATREPSESQRLA